jgi:hypothetical protein
LPARPLPNAAAPALLLIAIAGWEVCAARREAAAEVRGGYRPGDLIVFAPGWIRWAGCSSAT